MPLFGLNANDVYVRNLRKASDGTEIDDAVLACKLYDETQFETINNGGAGTAISGASGLSMSYQGSDGHYRATVPASVRLTDTTEVMVHIYDDGTYGIDVKFITTVERRSA